MPDPARGDRSSGSPIPDRAAAVAGASLAPAPLAAADAPVAPAAARAAAVDAPTERIGAFGVSVVLFLVTFGVYWLLGPQETVFDFQLSQANNLIHGHLDMTEEYTRNLGVLERVLYDGTGFCIPLNDPRGPQAAALIENPRITAECKHYMQHSLGPAFLLVPLALLRGLDVNQTLVSILIGAATAPLVFAITRRFSDHLRTQVSLTVLAMFGTILWWVASHGGVWFFAHTTAVFFLFASIYATLVLRSPLAAAALVGAAFLCRPTTILAGLFPLVVFSEQWLDAADGLPPWRRIRLRPLVELAVGVAPFVAVAVAVNIARFGSPFESGYNYAEQLYQTDLRWRWPYGWFDASYIVRHPPIFWEQMPIFATEGSFVWPSWAGLAAWVTTPPIFYALFTHRHASPRLARVAAWWIFVACALLMARGVGRGLGWGEWATADIPLGIHLWPFWIAIWGAVALAAWTRDRLVLACWAAIIPIALVDWMFAATGWAQYGYRYSLDFLPFVFLLIVIAVGQRVRWHHLLLIGAAVVVNLWAVLWIYKFAPEQLWGWTWVSF